MAITLLTAPPPALTPPELQDLSQSTPSTFEGIAPLLRHFEEQVDIVVEPAFEGFAKGTGSLWVTEGAVSFFSSSSSTGISLPYPHITLHAISQTTSLPSSSSTNGAATNGNGPSESEEAGPCLYCQLEEADEITENDMGEGMREMWIIPKGEGKRTKENLDKVFQSISYCASLNPAPSSLTSSSLLSESQHQQSSQASLFASMGLDPDSMVYADENGQLAGPGLALMGEEGEGEGQFEDVVEEQQQEGSAGRQRSDYVNPGRRAPY